MKTMKSFRLSDVTIERLDFIVSNSKYWTTTEAIEDLINMYYQKLSYEIKKEGE